MKKNSSSNWRKLIALCTAGVGLLFGVMMRMAEFSLPASLIIGWIAWLLLYLVISGIVLKE